MKLKWTMNMILNITSRLTAQLILRGFNFCIET